MEKGSEIGAHILSGNVFETRALDELIPNWKELNSPIKTKVTKEKFLFLSKKKSLSWPTWLLPKVQQNHKNYIISLANLCRWLAEQAEGLGVEIFPGFPASEVLYNEDGSVKGVVTQDMGLDKEGNKKDFNVNHTDYWFYTFLYDTSSDVEEGKENILETLFHNAIKEAYNSAESPQQVVSYGWLKKCITPDDKGNAPYPILENILKSVYDEKGWVPYSNIGDKIGGSLGKINRAVDILNLKPFLKCEPQHYENGKKGRIQMAPGSGALIKSVLDDLGT